MKKTWLVVILAIVMLGGGSAMANPMGDTEPIKQCEEKKEPAIGQYSICPKTKISGEVDTCLRCHDYSMRVREVKEDAWRTYPNTFIKVVGDVGHYDLRSIQAAPMKEFFDYLHHHNIKKAVLNIESWGGSLVEAWAIVGLIREFQVDGMVETRCQGVGVSAGFLILSAGSKRLVNPNAILMWHELQSLKFLTVETPSSTERDAKTKRWLQDSGNQFLADHSNMTKIEIDDAVRDDHELWLTGAEAVEKGFADGFIE